MTRILITGARGKTGAPLADLLAQRPDVEVLAGSSDPAMVRTGGVRPVAFSWDDRATWSAATEGVDAVYVVRPDRPDAPELTRDLLALTPSHARVVLLSELDGGYFPADHWALRVERVVREAGRPWTILRPGWFLQVLTDERFWLDDLVTRGRLPFPSGGRGVAWIDARDIAAVAERALLDPAHDGLVHDLTGPEALTLARTTEVLSDVLGRPVEHVEVPLEEAVAGSEGFDHDNDWGAFDRIRQGYLELVTDTVARVTGRPARTLADFAADHRDVLGGSRTPGS